MTRERSKRILYGCLTVLMSIQILLGFIWMKKNILTIPLFGDGTEYIQLSDTFALDEYRPILYPLFLKVVRKAAAWIQVSFQAPLYLIQTAVSFFSILFSVASLDQIIFHKKIMSGKRRAFELFFSLYLMTSPMMTFMNFSVLTDSLATSVLLLLLSALMRFRWLDHSPAGTFGLILLSLITESLLRADRFYSCLLLTVIVFLARFVKNSGERKRVLIAMALTCALTVGAVKGVGSITQTPGLNGRIETNLDFILLDRVVWPNMKANYNYFSEEIRNTITKKEAKIFDKHNNNVMYQMAPLLEKRVGKEKAGEMEREMAWVVFSRQPLKVMGDIGEDIAAMTFTPISSMMNAYGLCKKGDSWNIYCMSSLDEALTKRYNSYYQYSFLGLLLLGILMSIGAFCRKEDRGVKRLLKSTMPFWGMGLILTLWFCLGDGAPPNDRYALLIYYNWSVFAAGLLGMWKDGSI